MNRKLLRIGVLGAAILVIAFIGFQYALGSAVTAGVNRFGPLIAHTRVTLDGARISPLTGGGTLSGLVVGNPPGWSSDHAFRMESIHVVVSPSSLLGDHIIVKEVLIRNPEFVYETRLISSNIGDLLNAMESGSAGGESAQARTRDGKPLKFEVRHFRLESGRITLGVGPAAITLPMPVIDLTDLGTKEGGITPDQLALAVMRSVSSGIVGATTQAAGKIGSTMGAAVGSGLKGLFGGGH
jgi:hypothetical protein